MERLAETDLILNKDGSVFHLNVLPHQIADTIIAVGDPGLVHLVSQHFDVVTHEVHKREFVTHTGFLNKKKISVMSAGVGADNIEIFYNEIDALVNIDLKTRTEKEKKKKLNIVHLGESGAIQDEIKTGAFIIADYGVGLDNICHFYDLPQTEFEQLVSGSLRESMHFDFRPYCVKGSERLKKKIKNETMIEGNTVTCAGFYGPQSRSLRLKPKYPDLLNNLAYMHHDNFWLTDLDLETSAHYAMARMLGHEAISVNAVTINRGKNKVARNRHKVIGNLIETILPAL